MVKKETARVPLNEAARYVGYAIFGDEWVNAITEREKWLIERYHNDQWIEITSRTVPGKIGYYDGKGRPDKPRDPLLAAEAARARDRREWCDEQWARAFRWLKNRGFDTDAATVDGEALVKEVARAFPQNAPASKRKGGRPTAVDWEVVKKEALRLMDYHGDFGPDSPNWNARTRLEETLENVCDSKFGKRPAKSTLQTRLKPWLDEWRNSKKQGPET
jgi:hypothetical protein